MRALTRELRNSAEMTLVNLLMAGDAERDRNDWQALGLKYVDFKGLLTRTILTAP